MTDLLQPLTSSELADLKAKAKAATPGPYFAATDEAEDAPDHRNSGLALVDTGRREDWPIARLIEWTQARYIEATPPETVLRLIATIEQQAEQIEKLHGALATLTRVHLRGMERDDWYIEVGARPETSWDSIESRHYTSHTQVQTLEYLRTAGA